MIYFIDNDYQKCSHIPINRYIDKQIEYVLQ